MLMPLPETIIAAWAPFAALFTQPVWHHVQVLWMGAVLCCYRTQQGGVHPLTPCWKG